MSFWNKFIVDFRIHLEESSKLDQLPCDQLGQEGLARHQMLINYFSSPSEIMVCMITQAFMIFHI
jgi:hypothetical protein